MAAASGALPMVLEAAMLCGTRFRFQGVRGAFRTLHVSTGSTLYPMKSAIPPIDETEKHAAYAFYMGGFEVGNFAELMPDLNINTLKSWISQEGWHRTREAIKAANRKKNPPSESPLIKAFNPDKKAENVKVFQEKTGEIAKKDAEYWADEMKPETRLKNAEKIAALGKFHRSSLDLDQEQVGDRGHITLIHLNTPAAVRLLPQEPKQLPESES